MTTSYKVMPGPEHFLPPSASSMGIRLPDPGQAHIHGTIVPEEEAMEQAARQFLSAKVPTIFPGPLVLWAWNEKAAKKAKAIRHLYETIKECVDSKIQQAMLIPMPDYRPKYPKINPEVEINPISQPIYLFGCGIPKRKHSILVARLCAHGHRVTARPTSNNFKGEIGLMTMHTNEHTRVNFIMPNS